MEWISLASYCFTIQLPHFSHLIVAGGISDRGMKDIRESYCEK